MCGIEEHPCGCVALGLGAGVLCDTHKAGPGQERFANHLFELAKKIDEAERGRNVAVLMGYLGPSDPEGSEKVVADVLRRVGRNILRAGRFDGT